MSSFINFINQASGILSDLLGAMGRSDGCVFTLSGGTTSVSFPVSPSSFEVGNPYNNSTVNITNIGDINMLGKRGLKTLQFSSFFPAQAYPWLATYSMGSPYENVRKVQRLAESGQPCSISISGTDVSMPVSIDKFNYGEKDSSGDVYFTLDLKEYRYIMPESGAVNSITGMQSRIAETVKEKDTTCYSVSAMETARRAMQKTAAIGKQGKRTIGLYKAIVKSGGVPAGTILTAGVKGVSAAGKTLYTYEE